MLLQSLCITYVSSPVVTGQRKAKYLNSTGVHVCLAFRPQLSFGKGLD